MDTWFYNAMRNGIGGVPCGALRDQYRALDDTDSLRKKIAITDFLVKSKSGRYQDMALADGYLKKGFSISNEDKKALIEENKKNEDNKKALKRELTLLRRLYKMRHKRVSDEGRKDMSNQEIDDIEKILNLEKRIKKSPRQKSIPKDVFSLTEEGYLAYREMFDIGLVSNYRYLYKEEGMKC